MSCSNCQARDQIWATVMISATAVTNTESLTTGLLRNSNLCKNVILPSALNKEIWSFFFFFYSYGPTFDLCLSQTFWQTIRALYNFPHCSMKCRIFASWNCTNKFDWTSFMFLSLSSYTLKTHFHRYHLQAISACLN